MKFVWFILLAPVLSAQITLEDFKGCLVTSATPGSPTVVTCSQPHGFDSIQASNYVELGTVADGNTLVVGSQTWTLKSSIATSNQILIGVDNTHTMLALVNALNGTGVGQGTTYLSGTATCSNCYLLNGNTSSGGFWVIAQSGGVGGESITISGTGGVGVETSTLIRQIPMYISGATGSWTGIGSNYIPQQYTNQVSPSIGRVVSSTQLSIPYDSTGLTWDSQSGIFVRRASYGDQNELFQVFQDEGWANTESYTSSGFSVTVPACSDATNDATCSQGFQKPENQKNYLCSGGPNSAISTFVVSGSTITIALAGLWVDCGGLYPALAVGQLVWIRGYYAYSTATNPNSFAAQPAALAFAANAGGTSCLPLNVASLVNTPQTIPSEACRGFVVQALATINGGTQTQFTLKNPSDLGGLVNGSYTGTCADTHCPVFSDANGHVMITSWSSPYSYTPVDRSGGFFAPGYGVVGYAKYGAYPGALANPATLNRYRFYQLDGVTSDYATYVDDFQIGTYVSGQGDQIATSQTHYYHNFDPRLYAGQWHLIEATGTPSHVVGETGIGIWPNNPTISSPYSNFSGPGNPGWTYWYGMNNVYVDGPGYRASVAGFSTAYYSILLDTVSNEPDEWVPSRAAVWSPNRYISGSLAANAGYEATWTTAPVGGISYQVRYSTSDMKVNGFSTGLCKSGTTTCNGSDLVSADAATLTHAGYSYLWQSATLALTGISYIGIRPIMPITWAANSGQAYWVGSDLDPMMSTGDHVTIALNGDTRTAVATSSIMSRQSWFIHPPQSGTPWSGTGQLTSIVATGGGGGGESCEATLTVSHNLLPGWKIMVLGTTNATLGAGGYYAGASFFTVSSIPDSTHFIFPCANVPDGTYNSDAASNVHMAIMSYPGVEVSGTSPGYASGGTLTSTEDDKNFTELIYAPPASGSNFGGTTTSGGVTISGKVTIQ